MKNVFIVLLLGISFLACSKNESTSETDIYILRETLFDPGDGSGTFMPALINTKLTLFNDDTYKTEDGSICEPLQELGATDQGKFDFSNMKVSSDNCTYDLTFMMEADTLFIYLPCIEPCTLKFIKE